MRGKVTKQKLADYFGGITPAYAGKSAEWAENTQICWDHPRVCGEKEHPHDRYGMQAGSPPRMRGKERTHEVNDLCPGITPAYAGKSCKTHGFRVVGWDHPRVCGEKTKKIP